MTGMVMLHQVSFIFYFVLLYFFYLIIHLNTTVLETNIVTYLNIVRTKLTTLFTERLGSSSCHFHIILWLPQMMHRVHKDMKSSWILATLLKALESKLSVNGKSLNFKTCFEYPLSLRAFIVSKIISCWRTSIAIKNTFSISCSWDTANCKLQSAVTHLQFHFDWILNFRQTFMFITSSN